MNPSNYSEFIDNAKDKIYFYIEKGFWSKPKIKQLHRWLNNFIKVEEQYCALKLLENFVYYSEEDIIHLLNYGINDKVYKRYLLQKEKENYFLNTEEELFQFKNDFFSGLYFAKLDTGNQSQSSEAILRYLKIDLGIEEKNIIDINKLESKTLKKISNLILVDDFIGSGTQIRSFWNEKKIEVDGKKIFIHELKTKFSNIDIEYFCLVCTKEGLDNFKLNDEIGVNTNLRISYSEILTSKFKIFGADSMYFEKSEIEDCRKILFNLCSEMNINLLGYESLDYAVAFHHGIPDCSLPLFYENSENWNHLFRNKRTGAYE